MQILIGSVTLNIKHQAVGRPFSNGYGVDGGQGGPGCWKIETVPGVRENPNQANYYRRLFTSKFYQKGVFQYMFGGLLRAIFGVFSPYKYWDRDLEDKLHEDLRDSYIQSKRQKTYGIYTFKVLRSARLFGVLWNEGVRPKTFDVSWLNRGSGRKIHRALIKDSYVYVRINRVDWSKPVVDIEFYSWKTKAAEVITVSLDEFRRVLRTAQLERQADFDGGRLYPLYRSKRGKRL